MNLISAISWTIVLVLNIIICASDAPPNWITVFCALSTLTLYSWFDVWFYNRKK